MFATVRIWFFSLVLLGAWSSILVAQSVRQLTDAAERALQQGNFEEAAELFRTLLEGNLPAGKERITRFQYGYALFENNQPEAALEELKRAAGLAPMPGEAKAVGVLIPLYMGRAYVAIGSKMDPVDQAEERRKAFAQALAIFQELASMEGLEENVKVDIAFSKAIVFINLQRYELALEELGRLRQASLDKPYLEDIDYLIAFVHFDRATAAVDAFQREQAAPDIAKAVEIYQRLAQSDNLSLANDASFQLASIKLLEDRFEEALEAFRGIRSKVDILRVQRERFQNIQQRYNAASLEERKKLEAELQRERERLQRLEREPDLAVDALLKIGETYLKMGAFNEARVVFRHGAQFVEDPNQQRLFERQIIMSLILQGQTERAQADLQELEKRLNTREVQLIRFLMGQRLITEAIQRRARGENELADRLQREGSEQLDRAIELSPETDVAANALREKAKVFLDQNQPELAAQSLQNFLQRVEAGTLRVPPATKEDAKRLLFDALAKQKKFDEAVQIARELAEQATNEAIKENAAYNLGFIFGLKAQNTEGDQQREALEHAIEAYQAFAVNYPQSSLVANGLIEAAKALRILGREADALAIYRKIISMEGIERSKLTVAFEQIWAVESARAIKAKDPEPLRKLLAEIEGKMPDSFALCGFYGRMALFLDNDLRKPQEAVPLYQKVESSFKAAMEKNPDAAAAARLGQWVSFALSRIAAIRMRAVGTSPNLLRGEKLDEYKRVSAEVLEDLMRAGTAYGIHDKAAVALSEWLDIRLARVSADIDDLDSLRADLSATIGRTQDPLLQAMLLNIRGVLYQEAGQRDNAASDFAKAMDAESGVAPGTLVAPSIVKRRSAIWLETRDFKRAAADAETLIALSRGTRNPRLQQQLLAEGQLIQANIHFEQGRFDQAIPVFEQLSRSLARSPQVVEVFHKWGLCNIRQAEATSDRETKIAYLQEAVTRLNTAANLPAPGVEPTKAQAMLDLARALEAMGDAGATEAVIGTAKNHPYQFAIDRFQATELFYDSVTLVAAEALYRAALLLKNPKIGERQNPAKAEELIQKLRSNYGRTPWANEQL